MSENKTVDTGRTFYMVHTMNAGYHSVAGIRDSREAGEALQVRVAEETIKYWQGTGVNRGCQEMYIYLSCGSTRTDQDTWGHMDRLRTITAQKRGKTVYVLLDGVSKPLSWLTNQEMEGE